MRDTEFELLAHDKKHAYFKVFVHDKCEFLIRVEKHKFLSPPFGSMTQVETSKRRSE